MRRQPNYQTQHAAKWFPPNFSITPPGAHPSPVSLDWTNIKPGATTIRPLIVITLALLFGCNESKPMQVHRLVRVDKIIALSTDAVAILRSLPSVVRVTRTRPDLQSQPIGRWAGGNATFLVPEPLILSLTDIDPTTADVVIDAGSDTQFGIVILPRPGTLGVLNHPGEADGNLDMWFTVTGLTELLTEGELDDLASDLRNLDGILDAQRVAPADSPDHIPVDANLMVTFDGGASPGQSTAIQYDFGPDVRMVVFAVPEPTSLTLVALGLLGFVARGRRRRVR